MEGVHVVEAEPGGLGGGSSPEAEAKCANSVHF